MLRGITIFFCDNCRKRFKGLDMEYRYTILTSPQRCPYCGSYHTLPRNSVGFQDSLYATIWKNMDESGEYGTTCSIDPKKYLQYIEECDKWNSEPHDNEDNDDDKDNATINLKSMSVSRTTPQRVNSRRLASGLY